MDADGDSACARGTHVSSGILLREVTSAQTLILPCPWESCELPAPVSVAMGWFLDPPVF